MIDITLPESLVIRGLFVVIGSVLIFYGSVYLILYTNLGKKLAFLISGVGLLDGPQLTACCSSFTLLEDPGPPFSRA